METEEDIGGLCIEGDHHVSAAMCQIGTGPLYPVLQLLMTYPYDKACDLTRTRKIVLFPFPFIWEQPNSKLFPVDFVVVTCPSKKLG